MSDYPRNQWPHGAQNEYPDSLQEYPGINDVYWMDYAYPFCDVPATTGELPSTDGSGQFHGYHPPGAIGFPWDAAAQMNEGHNPGVSSSDINPDLFYHQGTPVGMPTSNQHQDTALSPMEISPEAQILPMANGPGPSVPSTQLPQPAVQPLPHGQKYECGICPKSFDRPSRAENCRNRHSGTKPHRCLGRCGIAGCALRYSSIDYVERHINPTSLCDCGESITRQNMSRHRAACIGHQ